MTTEKCLGIWMDHAAAHLIEFDSGSRGVTVVLSRFTHQVKAESLNKGEKLMHNKEQHLESEYYHGLGRIIQKYDKVILFGPTDAKVELYNLLMADHQFGKTKIKVQKADKMTENQQHAFVRAYFEKP